EGGARRSHRRQGGRVSAGCSGGRRQRPRPAVADPVAVSSRRRADPCRVGNPTRLDRRRGTTGARRTVAHPRDAVAAAGCGRRVQHADRNRRSRRRRGGLPGRVPDHVADRGAPRAGAGAAVTPSVAGAGLGLLAAGGTALAVAASPPRRRPRLDDRLAPYLRETPQPSRLLTDARTVTPFPTVERLLGPVIRDFAGQVD